jgi:CubicO group peptidase (beta-lactamase class C family)
MMKILSRLFCWLGLLALATGSRADKIDDYIKTEMEKQRIPGLSIAVVKKGNVVKAKGYGVANLELKVPVTKDTVFMSGSVGKQFTAAAVMLLVEDGKIGLDEKVSKYLPNTPDTWKEITVRHLLTHTSGLKDYQPDTNFREEATDAQMLAKFAKYPLDFAPGEHWSYSNLGYVTLGILVKLVSGKFYGDLLKERVFTPLGMTATQVFSESELVPHRAAGYLPTKDGWRNQEYVAQTWNRTADGSLLFTASDMAKWALALHNKSLFKPSTYTLFETPVRLNNGSLFDYSMGWAFGEARGHAIIEHGGAWLGFRTNISRYVNDDLTIVVLANSGSASPEKITHDVAELMLPDLSLSRLKVLPDPDSQRTKKLQTLLQDYVKGTADSSDMALGLRTSHSGTARSKGARTRLENALKAMKSFTYWNADAVQNRSLSRRGERIREILYYKLVGEKAESIVRFYLTGDGKVADFSIEARG